MSRNSPISVFFVLTSINVPPLKSIPKFNPLNKRSDKDKSKALKRLHRAAKKVETRYTPSEFLDDLLDMEWNDAEKNGGMTFMGKTIKGVTKAITSIQNGVLYGKKKAKNW